MVKIIQSRSILNLPGQVSYLPAALAYVCEISQQLGFSDEEVGHIRLATEEAITNVIQHGLEENAGASFELACDAGPLGLRLTLHEKGLPFSPDEAPQYHPEDAGIDSQPRGLGMFLMKQCMDQVLYNNLGREGKETVLVKYLKGKIEHGESGTEGQLPSAGETGRVPEGSAAPRLTVSLLAPQQALEVSRAAYRSWGYCYEDFIYHPNRIVEMNRQGTLVCAVAVLEDGRLCGHAALKLAGRDEPIAELGVAFVVPEFRKLGALQKMSLFLLDHSRTLGLSGLFVWAVTSHTFSQKTASGLGFATTAVLIGALPNDVDFKGISVAGAQKESAVLMYLPLNESPAVCIFAPLHHRKHIEETFLHLRVPVKCENARGERSEVCGAPTALQVSSDKVLNAAKIRVLRLGEDVFFLVKKATRDLCCDGFASILLWLDLQDPQVSAAVEDFEKLGFFYSGVLPFAMDGHHALILQYLNNLKIDYEKIKVYSELGQALLGYVKSCDPNLR